jgi:hypothetical protein
MLDKQDSHRDLYQDNHYGIPARKVLVCALRRLI